MAIKRVRHTGQSSHDTHEREVMHKQHNMRPESGQTKSSNKTQQHKQMHRQDNNNGHRKKKKSLRFKIMMSTFVVVVLAGLVAVGYIGRSIYRKSFVNTDKSKAAETAASSKAKKKFNEILNDKTTQNGASINDSFSEDDLENLHDLLSDITLNKSTYTKQYQLLSQEYQIRKAYFDLFSDDSHQTVKSDLNTTDIFTFNNKYSSQLQTISDNNVDNDFAKSMLTQMQSLGQDANTIEQSYKATSNLFDSANLDNDKLNVKLKDSDNDPKAISDIQGAISGLKFKWPAQVKAMSDALSAALPIVQQRAQKAADDKAKQQAAQQAQAAQDAIKAQQDAQNNSSNSGMQQSQTQPTTNNDNSAAASSSDNTDHSADYGNNTNSTNNSTNTGKIKTFTGGTTN